MMRKLIVLLAVVMVFGCVGSAYAAPDWLVYLKATDQSGMNYLVASYIFGSRSVGADGIDGQDAANTAGSGSAVALGCFDNGVGAANNGYSKDIRSLTPASNTWNLKIWLQPGSAASQIKLSGWMPASYAIPEGKTATLTFGNNQFVFNSTTTGTSTAPVFTWTIDNAQQYKGIENALEGTLFVPEPGSMLALASGLVGLVGFGIRRRK